MASGAFDIPPLAPTDQLGTDQPSDRARLGLGRTLLDHLEIPTDRPTDRLGTDRPTDRPIRARLGLGRALPSRAVGLGKRLAIL